MIPGSKRDHPSFVRSLAMHRGFVTAVKTERNIKVMLALGVAAVVVGLVLKVDLLSWCLIALCFGLVIFAELVNTAMEAIVDLRRKSFIRLLSVRKTLPLRAFTPCPLPPQS